MNYKIMILAIILLSLLISCGDEPTNPNPDILQITAYAPTYARVGAVVTLTGNKFGATQGTSFVTFNNIKATDTISWSDTQIKVKVPANATSGKVYVTVNGKKTNEVNFTVITYTPENYESIRISSQVWTTTNLNVDHYCNGDPIPQVQDPAEWAKLTTGAWCYHNNITEMGAVYGKLYNFYAVNDPRGLAPEGWHIASDDEWMVLESYLGIDDNELNLEGWRGGYEGGKLKEAGYTHWKNLNIGASDITKFTALPGGMRDENGVFRNADYEGNWWSSTQSSSTKGWYRSLLGKEGGIERSQSGCRAGFSVRCIKSEDYNTPVITSISPLIVKIGEIVTINGSGFGGFQGASIVSINSSPIPISTYINWSYNQIQILIPTGTVPGKLTVTANNIESNPITLYIYEKGTVQDIDGNIYNTVKIGNQWWTAENLKVKHYNNGDAIYEEPDSNNWKDLTYGATCYYDNDLANLATYGRFYNWFAIKDERGLAPKGWHIPTDEEWQTLYNYLGGDMIAGGRLKEKGLAHWSSPNLAASDIIDFTGLPGGCRYMEGVYMSITYSAFWWSSSINENGNIGYFSLRHNYPSINWHIFDQQGGCSVRCVKD
ncbi:MAG: FISUMP domain-containing protein [bacterium]